MIFDLVTEVLFAVLALVTPLLWIEDLVDFAMAPKRALVETVAWMLFTLLILRWIRDGEGKIRRSFFTIPILILLVLGLVSFVGAINIAMGVDEYLRYLSLAALFFAALHHFDTVARMERFLACLVVSATIAAVIGVCQYHEIAFTGIMQAESPGSTFSHQNMAAEYLMLILPFAIYFGLRARRPIAVHCAMAAAGLFVAFSFYARARATWVAMVVAAVVVVLLVLLRRKHVARGEEGKAMVTHRILASANALFLVILLTWVIPAPASRGDVDLAERVGSIFQTEEGTTPFRKECWRSSWGMMTNHPFLGVGIGHWEIYFPRYLWIWDREKAEEMFGKRDTFMGAGGGAVSAHNDYLLILSEVGLGGALVFLLLIYGLFRAAIGVCRRDSGGDLSAGVIALTGCVVLFGVISVFSFPLELPASSAVLFIALGMLDGARGLQSFRWSRGLSAVLIAALLLAVCVPVYHFRLLMAGHCAYATNKSWTKEETIARFSESIEWYRYDYRIHHHFALFRQQVGTLYLEDLNAAIKKRSVEEEERYAVGRVVFDEYDAAAREYEECLRQHPYHFTSYFNEALLYQNLATYYDDMAQFHLKHLMNDKAREMTAEANGMRKGAIDRYYLILRYLIDHPLALRQMAILSFNLREFETAERFLRHFLRCSNLSPRDRIYGESLLKETIEHQMKDGAKK